MRRSEAIIPTRRNGGDVDDQAVALANRAGLIRQFAGGIYGYTPTGERVKGNVTAVITDELASIGGQRISLPTLQPRSVWERSGRWQNFEDEMFTLTARDSREYCLAPTHEESVVHLLDGVIRSHDDVPFLLYQVGRKYRDDHPRRGLLRTKEFTMMDAYSVHADTSCLDRWYERVREAYLRIFERIGIEIVTAEADNAAMGGSNSEEFLAPVVHGSEVIEQCRSDECGFVRTGYHEENRDIHCPACEGSFDQREAIEVGHIFKLGRRYSRPMDLTVTMTDGDEQHVEMASYGIGIDRLVHVLLAQHGTADGCRWPGGPEQSVAPFRYSIVPLRYEGEIGRVADALHELLGPEETLLFDDADRTIGERFAESDLLGIPRKFIVGNHYRETGEIEIERRSGEIADRLPLSAFLPDDTASTSSTLP